MYKVIYNNKFKQHTENKATTKNIIEYFIKAKHYLMQICIMIFFSLTVNIAKSIT